MVEQLEQLGRTAMPQHIRHFRRMATQAAAARLIAASADAAGVSAAASAGSSSSAAAAAPTSSVVAGPAASSKGAVDLDMVLVMTDGVLPHSGRIRGLMHEVFDSEEILDSEEFLDASVSDLLVWTLAVAEFYETAPPLYYGFLLAQQYNAPPRAENTTSRPLQDILRDLCELWPNPQFIEHGVSLCHTVEGLTPEAHGATKTYIK